KMKQTARRDWSPQMARKGQAPGARSLYSGDSDYSHESCPTSSCDSCFGYIYDNGYNSNTEELDENDEDEDDEEGFDGWDQSHSQSSACPTPATTDPFSMSSMSSLFGPSSSSSSSSFFQQSQGHPFGASPRPPPPPPAPLGSRRKAPRSAQRCSCQKISTGFSSIFPSGPPPSGNVNGQSRNTTTDTQLSIFSNSNGQNGQMGTDNQTQNQTDGQVLGHLLVNGPGAKGKNGNGMVKNLNVYNPNITIQVMPENFSKFFPGKKSAGQWNGSASGQK
ncbi:hypothetical protein QBC32DRAFT_202563, partial [Pseudoneurospora amorphoporcata]